MACLIGRQGGFPGGWKGLPYLLCLWHRALLQAAQAWIYSTVQYLHAVAPTRILLF